MLAWGISVSKTMHRRESLSAPKIDAAKPKRAQYRFYDADVPQLYVRILPSGIKTWYVTWARNKDTALGKWPGLTVKAAREQARQALIEAASGVPEVARRKVKALTLRAFLDPDDDESYGAWVKANRKSGQATVQRIGSAFPDLLDKPLSGLNAWLIDKWRLKRIKDGVEPSTVNRDLVALKATLSKAVEWQLIPAHPLANVKHSKVEKDDRVRFLSDAEEKRLRAALAERDAQARAERASANRWRVERGYEPMPAIPADGFADHLTPFVLLSLNTGCRRGELTGLTWSAIDLERRQLTVKAATSKGARTRYLPLNDEALDVLERWRRQSAGERVFDLTTIKTAWRALLKRAQIVDFRPHDMRHHFASKLVQADVSLYHVQKLLGHSSLKMTERYSHVKESDLAGAVARLRTA